MEMSITKQNQLLGLTDEQKTLMGELKDLTDRMRKANLTILFDSYNVSLCAINMENVDNIVFEEEADETATYIDDHCEVFDNMPFLYDIEYRSSWSNPYVVFKEKHWENEVAVGRMIDAALDYC